MLGFDYGKKAIKQLLKDLFDEKALSKHPLINLSIVTRFLQNAGSDDTPKERARALADIIELLIKERLAKGKYRLLEWKILNGLVLEDKSRKALAEEFSVSRTTMNRYFSRACAVLAMALMELERSGRDEQKKIKEEVSTALIEIRKTAEQTGQLIQTQEFSIRVIEETVRQIERLLASIKLEAFRIKSRNL